VQRQVDHKRHLTTSIGLAVALGGALAGPVAAQGMLAPRAENAGPPAEPAAVGAPAGPVAQLFGVALESPRAELEGLARRVGGRCVSSTPARSGTPPREQVPLVCTPPPATPPLPVTATYWYEDDALVRAFFVDTSSDTTVAELRRRFDVLARWIAGALGSAVAPLEMPPAWTGARPSPDAQQRDDVLAGRARLALAWRGADGDVDLWLAGENGRVVLAVGLQRSDVSARCAPAAITNALLDLFPPAAPATRARNAALLASCHVDRAAGRARRGARARRRARRAGPGAARARSPARDAAARRARTPRARRPAPCRRSRARHPRAPVDGADGWPRRRTTWARERRDGGRRAILDRTRAAARVDAGHALTRASPRGRG
jgi:hypothetical protein